MTTVRPNWREIPYPDLNDAEIAAMPDRERLWHIEWLGEQRRDAARHDRVAAELRGAASINPTCGNCSAWANDGRSSWGRCWSRDSMGDEVTDGPTRITLASSRCEAWMNPAADMARLAA